MTRSVLRMAVAVVTGLAAALTSSVMAATTASAADAPLAPVASVAFSGLRVTLACSGGIPTAADFTFDYDPTNLRQGYGLMADAAVGIRSDVRVIDLPGVTFVPGGPAGTYQASVPLQGADAGATISVRAFTPEFAVYVRESRPVGCSEPETAPYDGPALTALAVDCAHHTSATFAARDRRPTGVHVTGEFHDFGVKAVGTTTVRLGAIYRAGDAVEFTYSDFDESAQYSWGLLAGRYTVTAGCDRSDDLFGGETLTTGQSLTSADGSHRALMQGDGNFVVYGSAGALFSTGTQGTSAARLTLQRIDSNLVLYNAQGYDAQWSNGAQFQLPDNLRLVMQDDGNLVEYVGSRPLWSSRTGLLPPLLTDAGSQLEFSGTLLPNVQLTNGRFRLLMQNDGNLVEYADGTRPVWSSGTAGRPGARLIVQQDGNVVVYQANTPIWQTGTGGNEQDRFVLQADGNVVVYTAAGRAVFATGVVR